MDEILQQVFRHKAEQLALIEAERQLSFGQLEAAVVRCTQALAQAVPHRLFAFQLDSRLEAIVLMLAAIRLGKTFVPIDAETAAAQRDALLLKLRLPDWVAALDIDSGRVCLRGGPPLDSQPLAVPPEVMAILMTAGGCTPPKAVMVSLAAVKNMFYQPDFVDLAADDVFASYSALSFDAALFEIFTPLLQGLTLVLLQRSQVLDPHQLLAVVALQRVSVLWLSAGWFDQLVLSGQDRALAALRTLVVGGDRVSFTAALAFSRYAQQTALYYGYGTTENTLFALVGRLTVARLMQWQQVPVGTPLRGVQCELFNELGQRIRGAGVGRLLLSGAGLALGYLAADASSHQVFTVDASAISGRYFDTGDSFRRNAAEVYFFLGRADEQVSLRGQLLVLDSIASRCVDGVVVQHAHAALCGGELVLLCHAPGCDDAARLRYRQQLRYVLSRLEQPHQVLFINDWPLTANGKIDQPALRHYLDAHLRPRSAVTKMEIGS